MCENVFQKNKIFSGLQGKQAEEQDSGKQAVHSAYAFSSNHIADDLTAHSTHM